MKCLVIVLCFVSLVFSDSPTSEEDVYKNLAARDDSDNLSYDRNMDADDVFELVQKVIRRSMGGGIRVLDLVRIARDVKRHADRHAGRVNNAQVDREISEAAGLLDLRLPVRNLLAGRPEAQKMNVALKLWGALADKGDLLEDQKRYYGAVLAAVSRTASRIITMAPKFGNRIVNYDSSI